MCTNDTNLLVQTDYPVVIGGSVQSLSGLSPMTVHEAGYCQPLYLHVTRTSVEDTLMPAESVCNTAVPS